MNWRAFGIVAALAAIWLALTLASQWQAGPPRPSELAPGTPTEVDRAFTLADLTAAEAEHLDGKRARFRVVLDSTADHEGKHTLYDCLPPAGVEATVWLLPGQEARDEMTVEARLAIIDHKTWIAPDGTVFPGFREYRLADAVRALP
jgi:hypothetical protein